MKKEEQIIVNEKAEQIFNAAMNELSGVNSIINSKPLRTCSARVVETNNYYLLKSYNTYIAAIEKKTDILSDVLRIVYGYTATSAQHVSKFEKDYCAGKWNCAERYTARA
jgi:hypothetical protein